MRRHKRSRQTTSFATRCPQLNDPDVQAAQAEFEALREALSAEFERARNQLAQLGDAQQRLQTIESNAATYPVPEPLSPPFSAAEAQAWVEAASQARTVAEHNLQQLAEIEPLAYLPNNPGTPQSGVPYDHNDVLRLGRNAQDTLKRIESTYASMRSHLNLQLEQVEKEVLGRWQDDPTDPERAWLFIGDTQPAEAHRVFDEAMAIAASAAALDAALQQTPGKGAELLARIDAARSEFDRKVQIALMSSSLPVAVANDETRLDIARQILANPRYGFGRPGPIVLTTPEIIEREREDSELEFDDADVSISGEITLSGTETTWTYRWKEFKFASPLQDSESGEWYVWWITARNFSSGGPTTPLGEWVSGEATKGNRILEENF